MRRYYLLALLAIALPASAAAPNPDKDKDSNAYDVEVLVFENKLPELLGDELLARDPATVRRQMLDKAVPPERVTTEPTLIPVASDLLQKDGHYRLLATAHWQQVFDPTDSRSTVKPIRIVSATPGELEGAIRFTLSRYLHLDVNMLFQDTVTDPARPVLYQLHELRRIKSQETHYFDHPRLGVLVRVTPLEKLQKP